MKPNIFLTAVIYISALTACVHTRHTTITTSTNGRYQKVEYAGIVAFHNDTEGVSMSPNSWLKYKENGLQLDVKCDESGQIYYKLNGEDKTTQPTAEEKSVLARAGRFVADNSPKPSHF